MSFSQCHGWRQKASWERRCLKPKLFGTTPRVKLPSSLDSYTGLVWTPPWTQMQGPGLSPSTAHERNVYREAGVKAEAETWEEPGCHGTHSCRLTGAKVMAESPRATHEEPAKWVHLFWILNLGRTIEPMNKRGAVTSLGFSAPPWPKWIHCGCL